MKRLTNRIAVVTGAGSGIGRSIALALAREGCHLALIDIDEDALSGIAIEIGQLGRECSRHLIDIADADAVVATAGAIRDRHGGVELLVNNAGVNIHGPFAQQTIADIDWIVDINLKGVLYGCHAFLPLLREAQQAHVVNIASLAGMVSFPLQSTYSASKFGVRGFSSALRMELAEHGIGVSTILPGAVRTPLMLRGRSYNTEQSAKMGVLMQRHGQRPDQVARAVLDAIRRNRSEVVLGPDAFLARWMHRLSPWGLQWFLQRTSHRISRQDEETEPR